jgi:hypothetical protein
MPVDPEKLQASAQKAGRAIGSVMPPGAGFALFVFDFGESGNLAYISNADRATFASAVREWLAHQEPLYVSETLRAARAAGREVVMNHERHGPADPLGWARRAGRDA